MSIYYIYILSISLTGVDFIYRELDELEREDFTRLKKVQSKKQEKIIAEEKARKLVAEKADKPAGGSSTALDGFDASDDTDVVFK